MSGPLLLAIESSCDETGHRPGRGRPADPRRTSSRARSRCTPRPAGSCPRSPRGPTCAGSCPSSTQAWPTPASPWADVDAVAVTYGPGLAGSLLVGINFAKTLAWVHDKPLVGVNHLEGHVVRRAGCIDPGRDRGRSPEPAFPLVALVVSGGHTFLVEMRDHLTYRLLGQTVDDAAGEAFDKVGRLLGLGYPGGPAIQRAAEGATAARRRVPAGLARRLRTTSASAGSRPPPGGSSTAARADEGLPPTIPAAPPVGRDGRRARLGLPGRGRRRPRDEDDPGRRGDRAPARSCSAAASRRTACCAARLAGEAEALGLPLIVPRPGLCTDNGAMIGAAGARRFAAGERAGLDLDARPSLPLARRDRPWTGGAPRLDPADGPPDAARGRASGPATRCRQNFLADVDVLEAILAEAAPPPGGAVLEIGPGLGILTGGLLEAGRGGHRRRARPRASPRSCATGSRRRSPRHRRPAAPGSLRLIEGDALDQDLTRLVPAPVRRRRQPAVPHHQPDPASAARASRRARSGSC